MFLSIPPPIRSATKRPSSKYTQPQSVTSNKSISSQHQHKKTTTIISANKQQQPANLQSIQNGFYVANLYKRFQVMDRVLFVLVLMNVVGVAVYLEQQMKLVLPIIHKEIVNTVTNQSERQKISSLSIIILWINLIITAMAKIVPASIYRYHLQSIYEKVQKIQFSSLGQFYQIVIIAIQPLPFLEKITLNMRLEQGFQGHIDIKLNMLLVIASIIKLLLIARYMFWHNLCRIVNLRSQKFFKPSYNRICKIYSCQNSYLHIMKCLFQQNFIIFIGGFYLFCMCTSAYCLRIAQTHYDGRFIDIGNCFWLTLLSMTTIGYGDIFVSTPIGIAIDTFLMFSGVVNASLLVSSLNDLFSMSYKEKRSLTLLKRLKDKGELKDIAGMFIARCIQRKYLQKKHHVLFKVSQQQRMYCRMFHQLRMTLRCGKEKQINLYRDMSNQFDSLKSQLDDLLQTCQQDILTLSQKQRLTLDRGSHISSTLPSRSSSSYLNILKMKSRDSRISMMQPRFSKEFMEFSNYQNNSCKEMDSQDESICNDEDRDGWIWCGEDSQI